MTDPTQGPKRTAVLAHMLKDAVDDLLAGPLAPMLTAAAGAIDFCLFERHDEFTAYLTEQLGPDAAAPLIDRETLACGGWLIATLAEDSIKADARTRKRVTDSIKTRINADKN